MEIHRLNEDVQVNTPFMHLHLTDKEREEGFAFKLMALKTSELRPEPVLFFVLWFQEQSEREALYTSAYPLEWGTITKNEFDYLVFKMGDDNDPLVCEYPFDPKEEMDVYQALLSSRQVVVLTLEGEETVPYVNQIRVCTIELEDQLYLAKRYDELFKKHQHNWIKYLNYVQALQKTGTPLSRWTNSHKFTAIDG